MAETKLVGVDVGGTFTDLVLVDEATGDVRVAKVPTTVANQAAGVQAALARVSAGRAELKVIVHGTTNAYITVGAERLSDDREFKRGTPAAINGFVQPVIDRYLRALAGDLARQGYPHDLLGMQGNGGTMSVDVAGRHAVSTLMSGPAA